MSTALERVDADTGELIPVSPISPATLFGTNDPDGVIAGASLAARSLAKVIKTQKLTSKIQGKDYVRVEGWTLLGSMLGVFPVVTSTHKIITEGGGWDARAEARTRAGELVGAAEAQCTRSEKAWANRDDYALRSMAQTRAISKALRMPLGFVMALAGFESTPAEEIPAEQTGSFAAPTRAPAASKAQVKDVEEALDKLVVEGIAAREDLDARMVERYGTSDVAALTKGQATELLERLKGPS
jgi:hypothetical protein